MSHRDRSIANMRCEAKRIYNQRRYINKLERQISKAIEYMKYNATSNYFDEEKNMFRREIDLLEILKGGEKNR